MAQPGEPQRQFVVALFEHQHGPLLRARDTGHQQAAITRHRHALRGDHHVVLGCVGLEHVCRHARNRRVEIRINPVAASGDAQRARHATVFDPLVYRCDQQCREQARAERSGAQPGLIGFIVGQQPRLKQGKRTVQIIDAVKPQCGVGRLGVAAPGTAVKRIAFEQIFAAAVREGEGIVVEVARFKVGLEVALRVGLGHLFAGPAERDRYSVYRASGSIMTADRIAQHLPASQHEVGSGHGQEPFGQDPAGARIRREQRAQTCDGRGQLALAQSVLNRTAKVFFVQSIDDDGGHTRFPGLAKRAICAALV